MKILILFFFVTTLNSFAIYDEDNRQDTYKVNDPKLKNVASAIAYQIYFDELKGWTFNRYWEILNSSLGSRGACEDERFSDQPSMRNDCSAILVGPKHLLLAGNCITDHYCKNDLFYWMFNYQQDSSAPLNVMRHKNNFYKCEKLLKRVFDPSTAISYAVIELNKEVKGITPVKMSKEVAIDPSTELVAMGHPNGLPMKVAGEAYVTDQNDTHFVVSSDISGDAKGTAIINSKTYELEGMLIYGRNNYEVSDSGCKRAPIFPFNEARELALKVNGISLK